jgi:hypothetical protein
MESTKDTTPTEAAGYIIDVGQDGEMEILAKRGVLA